MVIEEVLLGVVRPGVRSRFLLGVLPSLDPPTLGHLRREAPVGSLDQVVVGRRTRRLFGRRLLLCAVLLRLRLLLRVTPFVVCGRRGGGLLGLLLRLGRARSTRGRFPRASDESPSPRKRFRATTEPTPTISTMTILIPRAVSGVRALPGAAGGGAGACLGTCSGPPSIASCPICPGRRERTGYPKGKRETAWTARSGRRSQEPMARQGRPPPCAPRPWRSTSSANGTRS